MQCHLAKAPLLPKRKKAGGILSGKGEKEKQKQDEKALYKRAKKR